MLAGSSGRGACACAWCSIPVEPREALLELLELLEQMGLPQSAKPVEVVAASTKALVSSSSVATVAFLAPASERPSFHASF